jgi:hypothetical protein
MTGLTLSPLCFLLALAQATPPAPKHSWIADVRAARSTLLGKEVRVLGTVVDIRSTSAEARRGLYRLIDESDREGVLIRTTRLPRQGGTFEVRTLMAREQPEGALLLEEVSRVQIDAPPILPKIVTFASAGLVLLLGVLLFRAIREERRYLVSPPLWLLPDAGPYGKSAPAGGAPAPALRYDADLEEADRRRKEELRGTRRRLARMVLAALFGLVVGAGWLTATRPSQSVIPPFLLLDANEVVVPTSNMVGGPADTTLADRPIETSITPPAPAPLPAPRDTGRSAGSAKPVPAPPPGTRRDSVVVQRPEVVPFPAPAPAPAPPPPPPPPPPAPEVRKRSAEEERVLATEAIAAGINRIVAAANGKRTTELLVLLPDAMAGDQGRLERFVNFVKGFAPRATLGAVEPLALEEEQGQARFTVSFVWRGDFGVERRKAARFTGVVRRQGDEWRFEGARLLDAVP